MNFYAAFLIWIFFSLNANFLYSQSGGWPKLNIETDSKNNPVFDCDFYNYVSTVKLPDELEFCGEKAPLDIPEARERAEREFYLLLQQPGQIMLYLKRSGRYFPMYEDVFRKYNAPDDLKYLSVAESALYMSRSHAGAVGLWQFMKRTAQAMGLRVDKYIDERRHPKKSTEAAMKYLMQGYKAQNSWTLAAAGYNMGHGSVDARLEHQSGDDYFDLFLNEETSRYIFRILIIKEIMKNPAKYGFMLDPEDYYEPDDVKIIKVRTGVSDLADWAKEQGATYKDVRLLNPWILSRKLPRPWKGRVHEIAIPAN